MNVLRKLTMVAVFCLMSGLFVSAASGEQKIGFLLWNEQTRYVENKQGVIDQLKKDGFAEPKVKFVVEQAKGNKVKALEIAKKFADEKMDLVIPIGTSAAVAAAGQIKDIPIVFVMVWDPVESKIAKDWKSSGNNTTGASSKTPVSKLLTTLKEIAPVKKSAVFYTPGEKNSEIQLKEIEAEAGKVGIKVVPVPIANKEKDRIDDAISQLTGMVEAICLTGSSVIGDAMPHIVNGAAKARLITASQSEDHVEKGALFGVIVDAYSVGRLAGEKATKVLKGTKPAAIPIEPLSKVDILINMKTAKAAQIQIPQSVVKDAKVIE